jgi:predicted methyltransferase
MRYLAPLAIAVAAAVPVAASPKLAETIKAAVASPDRPADHKKLVDPLRKPADTLAFSGVRPGMTVGEFYPGGGYFTRMISDVVGPKGHVYGVENAKWKSAVAENQKLAAQLSNVTMDSGAFGKVDFPKPLDLAWVTQNYHDLKIAEYGVVDTVAFDKAVFKALKPGGVFFILDHQGPAGMTDADIAKMHRINRDVVVKEVTSAGFKLVAEGKFLRRPSDDHTKSIFDDAVKGHTDQYALKFVKPKR